MKINFFSMKKIIIDCRMRKAEKVLLNSLGYELIELEITEGMFYNNDDIIANFIDLLHEFGYTVLMDDFGSGYSNISSLATLNFDCIKLDKSLVQKTSEKQLK